MNIYDKWDSSIDTLGLQQDTKEAAANNGSVDFKEVPHGKYEVEINKMELKESKKGDPMVSIWFKILEGEFKNSLIFYNQIITQGFQVHNSNEMLRKLTSELENAPIIEFKTYKQYNDLILDVFEKLDGNFEYVNDYGLNKKGYNTYNIEQVFELTF